MRNNMHWRAGYKAYDQGLNRIACNSNPESVEWFLWQEGWTDSERDDKWLAAKAGLDWEQVGEDDVPESE